MGDVISSHLDEGKREIITGEWVGWDYTPWCVTAVKAKLHFVAVGDVISSHLFEGKQEILTGECVGWDFVNVCLYHSNASLCV